MKQIYDQDPATLRMRPGSRLIVRLVAEMQLASAIDMVRTLEEHLGRRIVFDRALFLLMILREGRPFRTSSTGLASQAAEGVDGISINAIAMSLGRPFETVRRHVNALIADGICERTGRGVIAQARTMALPGFAAALRSLHDRMVMLIEDLTRADIAMPAVHVDRPYDSNATIAAAIDLVLAPFEYVAERYASWLELVVISAVVIASSRKITYDPILSRRYADADTVPPADLRQPISGSAIARALRMSTSTVRREIEAAIASGKLVRVAKGQSGGLLATDAFLADVTISRGGHLAAARTTQVLRRLGPGGFPFHNPAAGYLDGRRPLVDFG